VSYEKEAVMKFLRVSNPGLAIVRCCSSLAILASVFAHTAESSTPKPLNTITVNVQNTTNSWVHFYISDGPGKISRSIDLRPRSKPVTITYQSTSTTTHFKSKASGAPYWFTVSSWPHPNRVPSSHNWYYNVLVKDSKGSSKTTLNITASYGK